MTAPARALTIAVTGGIASGKSEVTRRFQALGATVLDADLIARELVEPGQPSLDEIVQRFGPGMLGVDGRLDRPRLRALVFSTGNARRDLEAILHPRVRVRLREAAAIATDPYVLLAIPLLLESGHYGWIERVLVVDVPLQVQIARVMQRDGSTRDAAMALISAQATRAARLAVANDIIINDASLAALDPVVARLHAHYLQLAAQPATARFSTPV